MSQKAIYPYRPETEFEISERCSIVEILSSSDDPHCSIAQARVRPGVSTVLHSVKGTVERYVILEGVGEVTVGEEPARSVGPRDVVWIDRDVPQSIHNPSRDVDLVFLCICTPGFKPEAYVDLEALG